MTDTKQADEGAMSVTDPRAVAEREGLSIIQRTHVHEDREQYHDHCESDVVGRSIAGITDEDGRLLLVVDPEQQYVVLPNATVARGEDWATVGREYVSELAGIDVTLGGIERVRRIEHVIESVGTVEHTVDHVIFGGSVASVKSPHDELCTNNPFELGWYEQLPPIDDTEPPESAADVKSFFD